MGTSNAAEWFIDAGGPKRGPYSFEQIEQFYRAGQVNPDTVLYNSSDPQNPTTVRSLLDLSASALPARPSVDLNKPIIPPTAVDDAPDPTLSLFLTLQSTKHKKAGHIDPNMERTTAEKQGRFAETQLWFIGAMIMIVGTLVWGTTKLLNYSNELSSAKVEQPEAKPVIISPAPHCEPPTQPGAPSKKTLSDYMPKTTSPHVQPPPSRTAHIPLRGGPDRERQKIKDRETEIERERQRQRDMEYDRERERERDLEERELRKKDLADPFDHDAGVLQQAPIPAPPPPPSDPYAPQID